MTFLSQLSAADATIIDIFSKGVVNLLSFKSTHKLVSKCRTRVLKSVINEFNLDWCLLTGRLASATFTRVASRCIPNLEDKIERSLSEAVDKNTRAPNQGNAPLGRSTLAAESDKS